MKKIGFIWIAHSCLVVTIAGTSAGMLGVNKEEKKYSVSVIDPTTATMTAGSQCARDWSRQRKMTIFS